MCYEPQAEPPLPPGVVGPAKGEEVMSRTSDGNQFAAYLAQPTSDASALAQVIIYPHIRVLHQFYKNLALGIV